MPSRTTRLAVAARRRVGVRTSAGSCARSRSATCRLRCAAAVAVIVRHSRIAGAIARAAVGAVIAARRSACIRVVMRDRELPPVAAREGLTARAIVRLPDVVAVAHGRIRVVASVVTAVIRVAVVRMARIAAVHDVHVVAMPADHERGRHAPEVARCKRIAVRIRVVIERIAVRVIVVGGRRLLDDDLLRVVVGRTRSAGRPV